MNVLKLSLEGHNNSHESPRSPLHAEPKKQAQASRLQPPTLAKLSAFGWSGSTRFGARLRTKAFIMAAAPGTIDVYVCERISMEANKLLGVVDSCEANPCPFLFQHCCFQVNPGAR